MRPSATWRGRARADRRICARNASSYWLFCFVTAGFSADASIGLSRIYAGSPTRASSIPLNRLFSRMPEDAAARLQSLDRQLAAIVPNWSMAPVVAAYQAMRGVSFLVAVTFVAEIGDVRRFDNPRQLMSFLGLVPSERSTGEAVRRAGLTLAGNRRARRVLIEGAWTYRYPARVSETLRARLEGLPKSVRDIAWKGQVRLCARYRRLVATGKKTPVVIAAIAREMAAFLWAIAHQVEPLT